MRCRPAGSLAAGQSIITRSGEWVGRDWLRVSRGPDHHAGVIEREHRLKALRSTVAIAEERANEVEAHLAAVRESLSQAESERDQAQSGIQSNASPPRGASEPTRGHPRARPGVHAPPRAAGRRGGGCCAGEGCGHGCAGPGHALSWIAVLSMLSELDSRRHELEDEREERREAVATARTRAQAAQVAARDLLIKIESRRSTESSMAVGVSRMIGATRPGGTAARRVGSGARQRG